MCPNYNLDRFPNKQVVFASNRYSQMAEIFANAPLNQVPQLYRGPNKQVSLYMIKDEEKRNPNFIAPIMVVKLLNVYF